MTSIKPKTPRWTQRIERNCAENIRVALRGWQGCPQRSVPVSLSILLLSYTYALTLPSPKHAWFPKETMLLHAPHKPLHFLHLYLVGFFHHLPQCHLSIWSTSKMQFKCPIFREDFPDTICCAEWTVLLWCSHCACPHDYYSMYHKVLELFIFMFDFPTRLNFSWEKEISHSSQYLVTNTGFCTW